MAKAAHSVLTDSLRLSLQGVGTSLAAGRPIGPEFEDVLPEINKLPAGIIVRAEREIADAAHLYGFRSIILRRVKSSILGSVLPSVLDREQLDHRSGLEYLFIFHRDGYIREAALREITGGLASPFLFAAIAWRLNDWVPQVRQAALECARRVFPLTAPHVVANAALVLLARKASWSRWQEQDQLVLNEAFGRLDVASCLATLFRRAKTGPVGRAMQRALQQDSLDIYLEQLAKNAAQPSVRAIALRSLVDGFAIWQNGFEWQWVDKPMGIRRRIPTFDKRALVITTDKKAMILTGLADASAFVRKITLDCVIRHVVEMPYAREIAAPLVTDRAALVRERAEFIMRWTAERQEQDLR